MALLVQIRQSNKCESVGNDEANNNGHEWIPILHVLHHNRTQSRCNNFFLIYCKNITNFLFWVFWACLATSIKKDNTNL